jgi:hypothetical protein
LSSVNWGDLLAQAATAEGQAEKQLLPAGPYAAKVKTAKVKKTQSGKDQILVVFEVEGGPYAGAPLFKNLVISPGSATALDIFFRHLEALGVSRDYFAANPQLDDVAEAIKGRVVTVTTKQREYPAGSGRMDNDITSIAAVSGATPTPAAAATPAPAPAALSGLPASNGGSPAPF